MYESNDEESKRELYYYMKAITTKTTTLKTTNLCHVIRMEGMLFKKAI